MKKGVLGFLLMGTGLIILTYLCLLYDKEVSNKILFALIGIMIFGGFGAIADMLNKDKEE
jgi:hypothetical protein